MFLSIIAAKRENYKILWKYMNKNYTNCLTTASCRNATNALENIDGKQWFLQLFVRYSFETFKTTLTKIIRRYAKVGEAKSFDP